jgi:uncharacterized low-complexity protein
MPAIAACNAVRFRDITVFVSGIRGATSVRRRHTTTDRSTHFSTPNEVETMSQRNITPVAAIVGAALAGSLSLANAATTELDVDNLFAATEIDGGSIQLAGEGSCGEGKCGEGKCGNEGGDGEGEGSCGEGKCGGKG